MVESAAVLQQSRLQRKRSCRHVVLTEPELQEWDRGPRTADAFLRRHLRQARRLPNWTGPKDMTVLIYHLPR